MPTIMLLLEQILICDLLFLLFLPPHSALFCADQLKYGEFCGGRNSAGCIGGSTIVSGCTICAGMDLLTARD